MGLPLARVGDIAGPHGDILISGSPTVFSNGLPVHRATDIHMCPIIGVGITTQGSTKVLVNGLPAARVLSIGQCITPNFVISGSPNVNIGG